MSDFCTGCGRYLKGDELKCPDCGKYTQKGLQQAPPANSKRKRDITQDIILVGLCLVGMALVLMTW